MILLMAIIHMSEAEAAADFAGLLALVRAGTEVVIESEMHPPAVVRLATNRSGRLLSESLALAEAHTVSIASHAASSG